VSVDVAVRHALGAFRLDAAFAAEAGITALFGRSGAGKTTIVNAIAGLLRPEAGRIAVDGRVLYDSARGIDLPPHRRRLGYVFQDARLFPHLTVRQNLLFGRWFARRGGADGLAGVVEMLGIGGLLERRPGALSGGEKSRVAIGRALLARPEALLMDEPLASLDPARKDEILPYIERLRDEVRVPIVYVSHAVPEVARIATTIVLIEAGRVTAAGPAATLMSDPPLFPAFGRWEAGSTLPGRVVAHEPAEALTRVAVSGGELRLPRFAAPPGAPVTLWVRARDVILALTPPEAISALNVLPAVVTTVGRDAAGIVDVQLVCGDDRLLARITRASSARLGIAPGLRLHVVLKSVAFGRRDVAVTGDR
jgi:molybdate transport system ATP-binding protein